VAACIFAWLLAAVSVNAVKPHQLHVPVIVDLVGGYQNAPYINASAMPYIATWTWEILAATQLAVRAINAQSDILPQHDINLMVTDTMFNPAEAALSVTMSARDTMHPPSIIIGPTLDESSALVSVTVRINQCCL